MNVTALRAELEELERAGYGECRVSVYPALSEDEALGKYVLDFTGEEFAVVEIDLPGWPKDGFISLVFDLLTEPVSVVVAPGNHDRRSADGRPSS
jgi:hypothetical protein